VASPELDKAPEHLMSSRVPLLPETHFHAETRSPPRLEYPSSRLSWVGVEALLKLKVLISHNQSQR